ncbi:MAG: RNA methyltransferase [Eubacterium sp.]|nr:RNA methyltransferase [Eubacterium sp.]
MKFKYTQINDIHGSSTVSDSNKESVYGDSTFFELFFDANENQLLHYYEPELGLFVVESPMVIERALMAGYQPAAFVMIDNIADEMCRRFSELAEQANQTNQSNQANQKEQSEQPEHSEQSEQAALYDDTPIPVYVADYETIAGLTGVNITRGVLAMMKRRPLPDMAELIRDYHRIAIFDDVENPTNVGAMFRSAAALGIEAVILTGSSSDPLYRRASRVSVGTVFQVPWTKLGKKENNYIDTLHKLGFKTAAMALSDNSVSIRDERLKNEERLAIIMGNEGFGLSDEVIESSDYVVKIPMKNNVDSLNVAAASSIVFWELA